MKDTIQIIKKSFVLVTTIMILSSLVFAQGQSANESGTGIENPEIKDGNGTGNGNDNNGNGTGQDFGESQQVDTEQQTKNQRKAQQIQTKEQIRIQINDIKQAMQQKKQQMADEFEKMGDKKQQMLKNQNRVRLAVHSLLAMENLVGGIGPQVREIARNFNNSVKTTIAEEEKIQTRWGLTKFFFGGDAEAAEELETEVNENQQRTQKLKQLREQCNCDEEVKTMMQEQIQQMEQEQIRLKELAQSEKKNKGVFGWLWR